KMAAPEERLVSDGEGSALGSARLSPPTVAEPSGSLASMELPPQSNTLMGLPIVAIENILSFLSYDEISQLRLVGDGGRRGRGRGPCSSRDTGPPGDARPVALAPMDLGREKRREEVGIRESERRNHSLARHADILAAVETRLSLLNMTFMKYVDSNLCCFIPGKVIDEIYRVLRYVNSTRAPQRAHEVLQELRDISSMAMEYFDEKIVPILKRKMPGSDVSGRLIGTAP
ncbi:FBX28 protein, partial [Eolophus roseicapillus]|nr:FBX28 protein [Eolophus roseicapilla]